MYVDYID